jgi:hypothetical protein
MRGYHPRRLRRPGQVMALAIALKRAAHVDQGGRILGVYYV